MNRTSQTVIMLLVAAWALSGCSTNPIFDYPDTSIRYVNLSQADRAAPVFPAESMESTRDAHAIGESQSREMRVSNNQQARFWGPHYPTPFASGPEPDPCGHYVEAVPSALSRPHLVVGSVEPNRAMVAHEPPGWMLAAD